MAGPMPTLKTTFSTQAALPDYQQMLNMKTKFPAQFVVNLATVNTEINSLKKAHPPNVRYLR